MGAASDVDDDLIPSGKFYMINRSTTLIALLTVDLEEPPQSPPRAGLPAGFRGRPPSPNLAGRGRERSPESSPVSDTRQRQRRRFANDACDRIGVTAAQRAEVSARSQVSFMPT